MDTSFPTNLPGRPRAALPYAGPIGVSIRRMPDAVDCGNQSENRARPRTQQDRRPLRAGGLCRLRRSELDRATDLAEDRADLVAQEDQGDDRNDRDEGEDQRVLRETLAFLVPTNRGEELVNECHAAASWMSTHPRARARPIIALPSRELH